MLLQIFNHAIALAKPIPLHHGKIVISAATLSHCMYARQSHTVAVKKAPVGKAAKERKEDSSELLVDRLRKAGRFWAAALPELPSGSTKSVVAFCDDTYSKSVGEWPLTYRRGAYFFHS
ncbi:hypothetical protein M9H77_27135 [Catharanthus roseus]|uniref:Uncharacterized protein n=1 Tax=Catharanthus roseus TaxID=4058 RepID=A0ACC0AD32_CATRO|nr:hypothetical protein M9H77_27135 [Catharanthus roseus]